MVADGVETDVNLEALAFLLQGGEAGLALLADGHDAAGDGDGDALGFELLAGRLIPLGADVGDGVRGGELVGIGCLAQLFNFG